MDDPRTVVRRYLSDVLVGGNARTAKRLIANEPFRQRVAAFRRAFPDLSVEPDLLIAEGDLVAMRAIGRATHLGTFQGIAPTGCSWSATCTAVYRVQGGAIVDAWVQWDLLAILEQIGAVRRSAAATA
jgi:predicted ester cyclase